MSDSHDSRFPDEPRLGELLREARESRGLDLSEVAGLTNVRKDYLAALEEGRYSALPEDVYSRNFLRLFAQAIGFDEVRAYELYRSERREMGGFNTIEQRLERDREMAADVPPVAHGTRWRETSGPGPGWAALLTTLLMVAAVVGLALWGFNSTFFNAGRDNAEGPTPAAGGAPTQERDVAEARAVAPGTEETQAETAASAIPRTVRLSVRSTPPGAEVTVDEFSLPGTTPIESAPVTARPSRTIRVALEGYEPFEAEFDLTFDRNLSFALTPVTLPPPAALQGADQGGVAAASPDGAPPATPQAAGPGQGPQATLVITEDSWLEVYSGTSRNQGSRLAFQTARAGQTFRFPLPIYVHMGNAGGVELSVDGQDRGPLGSSGEVRGVVIPR
jgi:cytoskeleton protein RodZ